MPMGYFKRLEAFAYKIICIGRFLGMLDATRVQIFWGIGMWAMANRLRRQVVIVVGFCVMSSQVAAQQLPAELQQAWQNTKLSDSALSLVVKEVGGPTLIQHNATVPRNPASVMKMVTTWAGLSALGPEHTWRTTVYTQGPLSVDAQGSLQGPLYIKGSGDPFFSVPDLWSLLRDVRMRGVKNLSRVIVDRSDFGQVATDTYAFDGAGDRPYNASPDAMMVGFGASRLVFQPDPQNKKWVGFVDPPIAGMRVDNKVEWSNQRCPGSPVVNTQIKSAPNGTTVQASGTAAGSCGEFSVYRLTMGQEAFFNGLFKMIWKELGGTLAHDISAGKTPGNAQALVWHDSRSLADQIRVINKQSNNVMATLLLLRIGNQLNGSGATVASSENAAVRVLQSQGIDTSGWRIDNGSGLSRQARVTAQGLSQMLDVIWRSNYMPEFMSSLAIAGVDGTVRRRLRDDEVQGRAHLKTGTLRDARALAGYVLGSSGKRYIMVTMVNGEGTAAVRPFDDALVKWLAEQ